MQHKAELEDESGKGQIIEHINQFILTCDMWKIVLLHRDAGNKLAYQLANMVRWCRRMAKNAGRKVF